MKKETTKFELVKDGCLYDTAETTTATAARKIFAQKYTGKYQIVYTGKMGKTESKKVTL